MDLVFGLAAGFFISPAITTAVLEAFCFYTGLASLMPLRWQRSPEPSALSRVPLQSSLARRRRASLLVKTSSARKLEHIATGFLVLLAEEVPGKQEALFQRLVKELIFPPLPMDRGRRDHALALLARYAETHSDHRYAEFLLEQIHDDALRESCLDEHGYDLTPLTSD